MTENSKSKKDESKKEKMIKLLKPEELEEAWAKATPDERKEMLIYQKLPLDFITRHNSEIDFNILSIGVSMTEEVIDRFPQRVSWINMCFNGKPIADRILAKYINKIEWMALLSHQQLNIEFLVRASEHMRKARYNNRKSFWKAVSRYQKMDATYVKIYKRLLDFKLMSANTEIDEDVIDENLHNMDIRTLLHSRTLSKTFITKYKDIIKPYLT